TEIFASIVRCENDIADWPVQRSSASLVTSLNCKAEINQSDFTADFNDVAGADAIVGVVMVIEAFQNFEDDNRDFAGAWRIDLSDFLADHASGNVWDYTIEVFVQQPRNTLDLFAFLQRLYLTSRRIIMEAVFDGDSFIVHSESLEDYGTRSGAQKSMRFYAVML
ncbi:hypothetical protein BGX26_006657, partial [Mortierella sp. AD094]